MEVACAFIFIPYYAKRNIDTGAPRRAEEYIMQGLDYADRANNPARKAVLLGMASEVYHKLGRDSLALDLILVVKCEEFA